jgi:hypothetical protein
VASAEIDSGICGFCTTVRTSGDGRMVRLEFESTCEHVQALAEHLTEVDAFREISYRGDGPLTFELTSQYLVHPACGGRGRTRLSEGREYQPKEGMTAAWACFEPFSAPFALLVSRMYSTGPSGWP